MMERKGENKTVMNVETKRITLRIWATLQLSNFHYKPSYGRQYSCSAVVQTTIYSCKSWKVKFSLLTQYWRMGWGKTKSAFILGCRNK